jgi:hypothetical protein
MYTVFNFKTKKHLKQAVKNGTRVRVKYDTISGPYYEGGPVVLEGPHPPCKHTWLQGAILDKDNKYIIRLT